MGSASRLRCERVGGVVSPRLAAGGGAEGSERCRCLVDGRSSRAWYAALANTLLCGACVSRAT